MSYQNILVAVDIEHRFDRVLRSAAHIADKSKGKISIVTATPDLRTYFRGTETSLQQRFYQEFRDQAVEQIRTTCNKIKIPNATIKVLQGDADRVIADAASKQQANLIVFGNHDRHGLAHYIGGMGLGLLHRASCDLLAVHIDGPEPVWASPLVALAGDQHDEQVMAAARRNFPGQDLNVVHVVHADLGDYLKALVPSDLERPALTQVAQQHFESLTKKFGPCTVHITSGKPSEAIEEFSNTLNQHQIIMGSGRHTQLGWHLGSTAHNLLSDAHTDVLLIRPLISV